MEQHIIDLDLAIKQALHFEHPDMPRCINALEELSSLALHPLMLKKQPQIVTTVRKLRKYVGPQAAPEPKMKDEWIQEAQKIRLKANQVSVTLIRREDDVAVDLIEFTVPDVHEASECFCCARRRKLLGGV